MIRGLYTSALGMTAQMNRMDVISNNIANVDTTGYKKDIVVTRSFSDELMKRLDDQVDLQHSVGIGKVTPGVFVDDIYTDFKNGALHNTQAPLDVAIMGEGFFTISVRDADGNESLRYSRDGAFTLAADGTLMTKEGNIVMGRQGAIVLSGGNISIAENGGIYVDGELVDQLKMVDFEDKHTLRKAGDNLYVATDDSKERAFGGELNSGWLENANVNPVREMVDMITASRTYEANQRMVTIHDSTLARTVNDIGRK